MSGYDLKRCKTCKWWGADIFTCGIFGGTCCNLESLYALEFSGPDDKCEWYEENRHSGCGGLLEARVHNGVIEHYCYGCLATVLIDNEPIPETREWLK